MMATLRSFITLLLDHGWERDRRPKRKPGQKDRAHALLVAPQYSQKSPENNALFRVWLADFAATQTNRGRHPVASGGYTPRSTSSKWFLTDSLHRQARFCSASRSRTRIEPRRVSKTPSALST